MGNNISNTNFLNTTSWEWYQVHRIEKSSSSIKFFLDANVEYSNRYTDYIHCDRVYPYNTVRAGDCVQVNQGRTQFYYPSHEFTYDDNLEVIRIPEKERVRELAGGSVSPVFFYETPPSSVQKIKHYVRRVERHGEIETEYILYEVEEQGWKYKHESSTSRKVT